LFKDFNKYKIMLTIVIVIYTIVSFINLGSMRTPKTYFALDDGQYVIYELIEDKVPASLVLFLWNKDTSLSVFIADDYDPATNDGFEYDIGFSSDYLNTFSWKKESFNCDEKHCRYIMLASNQDNSRIGEVAFLDANDEPIRFKHVDGTELLSDEYYTVKSDTNYMENMYFDEIYFPRASFEIFNGDYVFESTHPPLGKIIMWIPCAIFGMTPLTFRFMGNLAGIFMILVMFHIGKELFEHDKYGLFAAVIMALDGMHFAQTRIATVDSFLVLFSMLAILFFIKYLKTKDDNVKRKYIMLATSGIMWGCAMATKWTSAYVGIGLGILFFIDYVVKGIKNKFNIKPILMGLLSFVLLPVVIYIASYAPLYGNGNTKATYTITNKDGTEETKSESIASITGFIQFQIGMFNYHANVNKGVDYQPHPYSSDWYTWPVIYKPMWFYLKDYGDGTKSTIASMGNPSIWWLSILTFAITVVLSIVKKDRIGWFLVIMVIATWLLFGLIPREMYIYHYFPTSVIMMLTIVYVISKLCDKFPKFSVLMPILSLVFLFVFIYFYPVFSGMRVSNTYLESTKWVSSWVY
jgi:dolichyl-phosphate-mannose--protein O-mannosyl transferase